MARDKWFETVAIAQERAKKRLPKSVYGALIAGSEKGLTVNGNVDVQLLDGLSADFAMKTMNGGLFTDFEAQLPAIVRLAGVPVA